MYKLIGSFISILFLAACSETDEFSTITAVAENLSAHKKIEEKANEPIVENSSSFCDVLPAEVVLQIFSQLSVRDIINASQVCKTWYQLSEDAALWREIRLHIHGDYPATESTKEQAKLHLLRMHVNTLADLTKAKSLINIYGLNKRRPFIRYQTLVSELISNWPQDIIEERATQGSQLAIERKMRKLTKSKGGYHKDDEAVVACNEYLIELGNKPAVERKINGLAQGKYGYKKDSGAAMAYNEYLIEQDEEEAIERKVKGLINGFYGYIRNPEAAVAYNESLISQSNQKAIAIKILGLTHETYGYKKNLKEAFALNESCVQQGSISAIEHKIEALTHGLDGYKEDLKEAISLNECLVAQGNEKSIKRKLTGLAYGKYGYDKDLKAAIAFNEQLIKLGNEEAIIRKVKDLSVVQDMPLYQKDLFQLKSWLEEEASKGIRWACYLKAQGLKYGILGFEWNPEAAIAYIKENNIPY